MDMNSISVVIPCFNEEEVLPTTYPVVKEVLDNLKREYEIIFVNDGSRDKTWSIVKEFSKEDNHVGGVSLSRNRGRESAIHAGLSAAKGDIVVLMDADLQDPPEFIPEMVRLIEEEGYEQVGAVRKNRSSQNALTAFGSESFYHFFNIFSKKAKVEINEREYRVMTRKVVNAILSYPERTRFIKGIWSEIGFKTYYLEYEDRERAAGETKYNIFKLLKNGIRDVSDYADHVLLFPLIFSVFFAAVALILLFFKQIDLVIRIMLLCFSILFVFVGIISAYIQKLFIEVKHKPLYSLDDEIKSSL